MVDGAQEEGEPMEKPALQAGPLLSPPKISLNGITLEMIVSRLAEIYGWVELGKLIKIKCFNQDPSVKSSLIFLRRTPWARKKVETLYLKLRRAQERKQAKLAKKATSSRP